MSIGRVSYGKELNYPGYLEHCMVGRVSYLGFIAFLRGRVTTTPMCYIPYRTSNYTLLKPYPFIITYPIHHPTLGTQSGRVLPCASINTTLPWIPTYPYPLHNDTLPEYLPYLPTLGKIPIPTLSIYHTYPIHVTSACTHLTLPFITYPNLHFPTLYYCQGLIKYKAETIYQSRPKRTRAETNQADTTQAETTQGRNDSDQNAPRMQLRW